MSSILLVITVGVLVLAKQLLIPIAIGLFLSLGLSPLVERFKRWGFHRIVAIISTFLITLGILGAIGVTVGFAVNDFVEKLPEYSIHVNENITATKTGIMNTFQISETDLMSRIKTYTTGSSAGFNLAGNIITTTTNVAATLGLSIVITFLMLLYRTRIKNFFQMVADENRQAEILTIVRKSFHVLPRYITGLGFVIVIMTVLNSLGFWLIGIPSPLFWGIIVSLLNVIPYVGTVIGFGGVVIFALIVVGPPTALLAIIMFLVIQFVDNNFLTPVIAGNQININPLAAILSIIIWGMIWGVIGMVLALPILGLIKIICDTIVPLRPVGYLLGDVE